MNLDGFRPPVIIYNNITHLTSSVPLRPSNSVKPSSCTPPARQATPGRPALPVFPSLPVALPDATCSCSSVDPHSKSNSRSSSPCFLHTPLLHSIVALVCPIASHRIASPSRPSHSHPKCSPQSAEKYTSSCHPPSTLVLCHPSSRSSAIGRTIKPTWTRCQCHWRKLPRKYCSRFPPRCLAGPVAGRDSSFLTADHPVCNSNDFRFSKKESQPRLSTTLARTRQGKQLSCKVATSRQCFLWTTSEPLHAPHTLF